MIEAVFIIHHGVCLFSRQYSKIGLEKNLFSSFITAINQFATQISGVGLSKFIVGDSIFSLSLINNILFVYKHEDLKASKLEKISNSISNRFLELFNIDFSKWDGEITMFQKFGDETDKILSMKGREIGAKMHDFALRF